MYDIVNFGHVVFMKIEQWADQNSAVARRQAMRVMEVER
jgi:hypothetical protein